MTDGSSTIVNCTIAGNRATAPFSFGGGFCIEDHSLSMRNTILWGNQATSYPHIAQRGTNTVSVRYSDIEDGSAGTGNISSPPLFVSAGHWDDAGTPSDWSDDAWVPGDFRLSAGSPCIDAGDGAGAPGQDLDGNPRADDPATPNTGAGTPPYVDMGAYEYQP